MSANTTEPNHILLMKKQSTVDLILSEASTFHANGMFGAFHTAFVFSLSGITCEHSQTSRQIWVCTPNHFPSFLFIYFLIFFDDFQCRNWHWKIWVSFHTNKQTKNFMTFQSGISKIAFRFNFVKKNFFCVCVFFSLQDILDRLGADLTQYEVCLFHIFRFNILSTLTKFVSFVLKCSQPVFLLLLMFILKKIFNFDFLE